MSREEVEDYASSLNIDVVGHTLVWIQERVYEVGNGIAPEADDGECARFSTQASHAGEDELPAVTATEDEMRSRMFDLAAETVGNDYDNVDKILHWCPTLPSGERADCWLCPSNALRSCYRSHTSLLE